MKKQETSGTKIIVLGGLGEVGKNMYCVMHNLLMPVSVFQKMKSWELIMFYQISHS